MSIILYISSGMYVKTDKNEQMLLQNVAKIMLWSSAGLGFATFIASIIYTYVAEEIMHIPTWNYSFRNANTEDDEFTI